MLCVLVGVRLRPIDILHCDPLTPDNSNQWDEWEASSPWLIMSVCEGARESDLHAHCRNSRAEVHKRRHEVKTCYQTTQKDFSRFAKKGPIQISANGRQGRKRYAGYIFNKRLYLAQSAEQNMQLCHLILGWQLSVSTVAALGSVRVTCQTV